MTNDEMLSYINNGFTIYEDSHLTCLNRNMRCKGCFYASYDGGCNVLKIPFLSNENLTFLKEYYPEYLI